MNEERWRRARRGILVARPKRRMRRTKGKKASEVEKEKGRQPSSSHRKPNCDGTHGAQTERERQPGSHTYLHTSHSIDRAPNWLPGCLARCTAGFQPGSTTTRARRRTHIYIKPLSAYGRTIGRSAGRSESEEGESEERGRKEAGGEKDGRAA